MRKKLNQLKADLVQDFGAEVSRKSVKKITDAVRGLEKFEKKGIAVSAMYNIECDYRYLYVSHNYVFYRIESEKKLLLKCLMKEKILCISYSEFQQEHRNQ